MSCRPGSASHRHQGGAVFSGIPQTQAVRKVLEREAAGGSHIWGLCGGLQGRLCPGQTQKRACGEATPHACILDGLSVNPKCALTVSPSQDTLSVLALSSSLDIPHLCPDCLYPGYPVCPDPVSTPRTLPIPNSPD